MADASLLGRVLWYELLTSDPEAAKAFYAEVVGWAVAPFREPPDAYDMWVRGEVPIGGVMAVPAGVECPPSWGMYVGVPGLEEGVAHAERLGASPLSEVVEVPEVGRMRVMQDPQGAPFALYQPASPPQHPESEPEVGDVSWHELYTTDAEAAMAFYGELFGWHATESMDMGEMGRYQMFGRTFPLGGMMSKPPMMAEVPPCWGFYFRVPDVAAAAERVRAAGGQVTNGPMEVPGGDWIVNCVDPQGAAFALHHKA